jgi:hypothetical protein
MALVGMVCLVLALTSAAFACETRRYEGSLDDGKVFDGGTVYADVGPYAEVRFLDPGKTLKLSGAANSTDSVEIRFSVETNCPIKGSFEGTALKQVYKNETFYLETQYSIDNKKVVADAKNNTVKIDDIPFGDRNRYTKTIIFSAKTGAISAQEYGKYSANVTLTVSQP